MVSHKKTDMLRQAIKIREWIVENDSSYSKAAENFNCSPKLIERRLRLLGVEPVKRHVITKEIVREAITAHLKTGSINNVALKYKFSIGRLGKKMRDLGYSLTGRCYVEKPKVIDMQAILCSKLI